MTSKAATVEEFMAELSPERYEMIQALRETILANLSEGFVEGMQYGGISYFVPHSLYPAGYHCDPKQPVPFAGIMNQKAHVGLYLFCLYCDQAAQDAFVSDFLATGKKLDMGKSCVRFRSYSGIPLEVIGKTISAISVADFLEVYEASKPKKK
ncbi:MAG: DUF1801 domain-containing protein [Fimbriimonadaceae bacterium]|jgi:hypothetical protein|nr:DUF1801 domain-containing protein [Fimbriimonadaceae bacterium]